MSLALGTQLGPYEIQSAIGAGGMGEVYKARDARLGRTVAIKVLPERAAGDPARRVRFEQEARAASALNHPHICVLHDVGRQGDTDYLVMEYLEGETLARRLRKGPLPLGQALELGAQIADALARAHRHGIVHRDLKPSNVMLTKDGAKLLDFGLATLRPDPVPVTAASAVLSTATIQTTPGVVMGTVPYMAPEQLEGKDTDGRTDLFAFGGMLYEMLTGRRAFPGENEASVASAILTSHPSAPSTVAPATPPLVDRLVHDCLSKSPDERPDSARDVAKTLRWVRETAGHPAVYVNAPKQGRAWRLLLGAVAVAGAGALFVLALGSQLRPFRPAGSPRPPAYATIPLKTEQVYHFGHYAPIATSPDGEVLVFREGKTLVRRPLNGFEVTAIGGTEGASMPAFKPDGTALAFVGPGGIKRVSVSGEKSPAVIASTAVGPGLVWGEDDWIYYARAESSGIWRVPSSGQSRPEVVTRLRPGEECGHAWPQLLPGGKALLFTELGPSGGASDGRVVIEVLATHDRTTVVERATSGRYLASGHVVFGRDDGFVYAVPFDVERLQATGPQVPVLSHVGMGTWGGAVFLAVSDTGTAAFLRPTRRPGYLVRLVDNQGRPAPGADAFAPERLGKIGGNFIFQAAPDGERYVFTAYQPGSVNLYSFSSRTGQAERLTFGAEEDEGAAWSPDGGLIAYTSAQRGSARHILVKTPEGGAKPRLLRVWPRHVHVNSWSPDGRWLLATDFSQTTASDVWAFPVGGGEPVLVAGEPNPELWAHFSPDGKWVSYRTVERGRRGVYVVSFPDLAVRREVTTEGDTYAWARNGRFLYYLSGGSLVALEVSLDGGFRTGRTTPLFATRAVGFQVLPEGRFALLEENDAPPDEPLHVIFNWFEELQAKAPLPR